jgi:predicted ATPase/DNA-binding SARP family transcriptional activator
MSAIKIFLFGTPRLACDGQMVEISRRKTLALLAYLAVNGQIHTREYLATLLWPESDASTGRGNLRRALYELNQILGEEHLHATAQEIGLQPHSQFWLDVREYQEIIGDCLSQSQTSGSSSAACLQRLSQAAELYTADFLAGFSLDDSREFDEWQFFQAEGLRQSFARLLSHLAQTYQSQGNSPHAIEHARRWLALDPLHEPAHCLLMQVYAQAGQYSAAARQYEICVQTLERELGMPPQPETRALFEQIQAAARAPSRAGAGMRTDEVQTIQPQPEIALWTVRASPVAHNLPAQLTAFIGRRNELNQIKAMLSDSETRLLSLVGPGGIGKTRLALQAATELATQGTQVYADGIYFVPLASLNASQAIPQAIAKALRFPMPKDGKNPSRLLLDYLKTRRLLLVLDNYEHLSDEFGIKFPLELLEAAPGVQILLTSRIRLNVRGEQLYAVGGMAAPELEAVLRWSEIGEELAAYSALQLFREAARRSQPDFELTAETILPVARICRLVQGMPLGIELAAAWMAVFTPQEIAAEIERSLDFLESQWQDIPERQRSLRAVFETSWKLLTEDERRVFLALSLFRGGCEPQAARQVSRASAHTLLSLANKSWLQRDASGRYQMHELLRQYAQEELRRDTSAWQQAGDRHSAYFAAFIQEQGAAMKEPEQAQAFDAVAADLENILAAWRWLREQKRFDRLMSMLYGLFRINVTRGMEYGILAELDATCTALTVVANIDSYHALSASLLTLRVRLHRERMMSAFGEDRESLRRAWDLASQPEVEPQMGFWSVLLAELYAWYVDRQAGIRKMEAILVRLRQGHDVWEQAYCLSALGVLLTDVNRRQEAKALLLEAFDLYRLTGSYDECSNALRNLGAIAIEQHAYAEAARYLEEALKMAEKAGDQIDRAMIVWELGSLSINQGEFERAFEYFRESQRLAAQANIPFEEAFGYSSESMEALRYSTIEQAKTARRKSLAISERMEDPNGIAWSRWEMGEIFRVEGDLEEAQRWYAKAHEIFNKHRVTRGLSFYHRGLGDIAQMRDDFSEAQRQFQESLHLAEVEYHRWGMAYSLCGLGRAELCLGELEQAERRFLESLQIAHDLGNQGLMMIPLAGLAGVWVSRGEAQRAIEVCAFLLNHYAAWRETKSQAARWLALAVKELPEEAVSAAQVRGEALESAALIEELLANS